MTFWPIEDPEAATPNDLCILACALKDSGNNPENPVWPAYGEHAAYKRLLRLGYLARVAKNRYVVTPAGVAALGPEPVSLFRPLQRTAGKL